MLGCKFILKLILSYTFDFHIFLIIITYPEWGKYGKRSMNM